MQIDFMTDRCLPYLLKDGQKARITRKWRFYKSEVLPNQQTDEDCQNTTNGFPISELRQRYGIGRTLLYIRLLTLSISPQRSGRNSFITAEELQLLDEFDAHLQTGGKMDEFAGLPQQTLSSSESDPFGK